MRDVVALLHGAMSNGEKKYLLEFGPFRIDPFIPTGGCLWGPPLSIPNN